MILALFLFNYISELQFRLQCNQYILIYVSDIPFTGLLCNFWLSQKFSVLLNNMRYQIKFCLPLTY
jgi:hypothetical protein